MNTKLTERTDKCYWTLEWEVQVSDVGGWGITVDSLISVEWEVTWAILVLLVHVQRAKQAVTLSQLQRQCVSLLETEIAEVTVEKEKMNFSFFHRIEKEKSLLRLTLSWARLCIRILLIDKECHKTPVLGNKTQQHSFYTRALVYTHRYLVGLLPRPGKRYNSTHLSVEYR